MALDDIFKALEEQADKECEEILQDARDQAQAIAEDAAEQSAAVSTARVDEAERLTRNRAAQTVNSAKLESKKRVASVKERAVSAAFDDALGALGAVRSKPGYPEVFRALAEEAMAGLQGDIEVLVDPADAELARSTFASLGVTAEIKPELSTAGGLIVATHGGRIARRNTVEDRLEKVRQYAQADVAEILFS